MEQMGLNGTFLWVSHVYKALEAPNNEMPELPANLGITAHRHIMER